MISLDFSVFYQVVIFLVLWVVLSRVLFRPYIAALEERERNTSGAQYDTEALEREGARLKAQYEEQLARVEAAAAAVKETILQEARHQREQIIGRAREEASAALDKARQEIQAQIERERQRALAEIGELAREMVSKILQRSVA
jgi:F-type H+-transporting ATPase subunit b